MHRRVPVQGKDRRLTLDGRINSAKSVAINCYLMFVFAALKFAAYVRELPSMPNSPFLFRTITFSTRCSVLFARSPGVV